MKRVDKGDEFICWYCRKTEVADWTHEEAMEEARQNFPDGQGAEELETGAFDVVCDDCYKALTAQVPPPGQQPPPQPPPRQLSPEEEAEDEAFMKQMVRDFSKEFGNDLLYGGRP